MEERAGHQKMRGEGAWAISPLAPALAHADCPVYGDTFFGVAPLLQFWNSGCNSSMLLWVPLTLPTDYTESAFYYISFS